MKTQALLRRWNVLTAAILAAGAIWIAFTRTEASCLQPNAPAPRQGFPAPNFSLPTAHGETITLSALQGQVVLVNFWASWCPHCRGEMATIQAMYQDYREQGLIVLAVNAADQDDFEAAWSFVRSSGLSFPILFDADGNVYASYQVPALPTSFLIDRQGRIREVVVGKMSKASWQTRIQALLGETP